VGDGESRASDTTLIHRRAALPVPDVPEPTRQRSLLRERSGTRSLSSLELPRVDLPKSPLSEKGSDSAVGGRASHLEAVFTRTTNVRLPVKRTFSRHRRMTESDPNSDILKCRQSNRRNRLKAFKHQFNVAGGPLELIYGVCGGVSA
jgi:hypothetical protein